MADTDSEFESYDSDFDYISALEVNPTNGHLFVATNAQNQNIYRYDGTSFTKEFDIIGGAGPMLLLPLTVEFLRV